MARRGKASKRKIAPDQRFNNELVAKFINHVMKDGKKTVAKRVVYDAFDIVSEKTKKDPVEVFDLALRNIGPSLEIKGRRIGGANYQIPYEVHGERRNTLAMRWIIDASAAKKGQPMCKKLSEELILASDKQGNAYKKREDIQRMAEANKAFAHFAR
ncbi:30S ribosomal protein S7 [Patescibacteria group bacterium]|nr:30S ribosomal protein S7 [Patescibacteria group bacterium]